MISNAPLCLQTIVTGAGDETLRFWNIFPSVKTQVLHPSGFRINSEFDFFCLFGGIVLNFVVAFRLLFVMSGSGRFQEATSGDQRRQTSCIFVHMCSC